MDALYEVMGDDLDEYADSIKEAIDGIEVDDEDFDLEDYAEEQYEMYCAA